MLVKASGAITSSGVVNGVSRLVAGISAASTSGTNLVTVAVYDGANTSGRLIWSATLDAWVHESVDFAHPVILDSGSCYVNITGAGSASVVIRGL